MTDEILIAVGIIAAVAVIYILILYFSSLFLINVAIGRKEPKLLPKIKKKMLGSPKTAAFMNEIIISGQKLAERECERVAINAYDGVRLVGHIYHAEAPKRVIIAMHGWRSSWSQDFGTIAEFWKNSGCTVIYAEQRGQNESGGKSMGFGITERRDCISWINYSNKIFGTSLPTYLAGVSMGATSVLMAAEFDLPANVAGIIADCGFTNPDDIWRHVVRKNLGVSYKLRRRMAFFIYKRKTGVCPNSSSTIRAMEKCRVPVLFIHGDEDSFVPPEMTLMNYEACRAEKRLLIAPGANHGMSHYVDRERYENAFIDFFKDFD